MPEDNPKLFRITLGESFTTHYGSGRGGDPETIYLDKDEDPSESAVLLNKILLSADNHEAIRDHSERKKEDFEKQNFDFGYDVVLTTVDLIQFAGAAGIGAFLKDVAHLLIRWKENQNSRWIEISWEGNKVSVHNPDDLEKAVATLKKLKSKSKKA